MNKKNKIKISKKVIVILILILTLFSNVSPILAASGSGKWVGGQYASNIKTTDHLPGETGILIRRLINYTTGEKRTVFCAEHKVDFETGTIYDGSYYTPTDENIKLACKIAYFGWYSKYGDYVVDGGILAGDMINVKMDYVFTQQYIWEALGQTNATFIDESIQSQYSNFKNNINSQINNMKKRPSFDATTITLDAGETKTITDTNGVLQDYGSIDKTKDGIRFQHNKGENTLKITVPENCTLESLNISDATFKEWGMIKADTEDHDTTIYFTFEEGVQNQLYALHYNDPVTLRISLKINLLGNIELTKTNTNNDLIDGSIFNVTGPNNYNKDFTVRNGKLLIEKVRKGTYKIKEIFAPEGYVLDSNTYTVEVRPNETTHQTVVNEEPKGKITIIKKDSETGNVAQGDATLENAIYKVYANEDIFNVAKTKKFYSKGDLVATRTTNKNGETEAVTDLPLGKYLVKEEKAPTGYMIDKTEYEVNLTYKDQHTNIITGTATSKDKVKKMQVHIFKSGIKDNSGLVPGLAGAEFTIKLYSDVEKALSVGYSYAEIWNGLDEYGNTVKVDSKRVAEAQKISPSYESIVTDENGDAYTQNKLPYGKYLVKETKTPKDYYVSSDFTFTISEDESEVVEIAKKVKHLYVNNEQMETYIKLVKKDKDSGKIVTLNSATFQIKATKDIYDRGNGNIIYKKGEIITQKIGSTVYNSFTTNSDNLVIPERSYNSSNDDKGAVVTPLLLPVGEYEVTELKIPSGYLELESPIKFKIDGIKDYDKDNTGDYIKTVEIKNSRPYGTLIVDKSVTLKENVDTSIVDISDLSGIQFRLSAKEDVIDPADGSIIYKKGQEIKTYNVDKDGNLKVENLPMGTYELQEIKTLEGLVLNETKYEVKFTQEDTKTKVYTETREIKNDTTLIEISKTTITSEKELPGAKLSVLDEKGNVIDSWTSTDKAHTIEGLTVGKEYILREDLAPLGYVKSTDVKFRVENTNEIQKVTMIDKIVEMTKEDIGGKEVEGAELKVVDKDGKIVDSWISTNEAHRIKGLIEGESYTLYEDYAPDGYVISNEVTFTVTTEKETQKVLMTDKIVEVLKTDIDGNTIEGVTLSIISTKTKNIVDKWETTNEAHKVNGLIEGQTYILREEKVIDGYVKATDIEFTVTSDKETQKIVMIDKVVEIIKTDFITGQEIEGAELQVVDEDGNIIDEWVSTKEPHKIKGLEENKKYKLIEKTAPYGYELTEEIEFTVTTDKETQKIEMKDMPILKTIKVIKADSETKETIKANFKFGIYEDQECTKLIKEVKSDKDNGTVSFEDLRYGTYYIKETEAPKGYQLSDKIVKIEINDKGTFADGELLEDKDSICTFTYYNKLVPKVQTGNEMNYAILIGSIIISLLEVTAGIVVLKRKKQKNK